MNTAIPNLIGAAKAAIDAYDAIVRANTTPDYDALAAVATCDEGVYGAWGEVIDTAEERGYPVADDAALDVLEVEYDRLRAQYRTER